MEPVIYHQLVEQMKLQAVICKFLKNLSPEAIIQHRICVIDLMVALSARQEAPPLIGAGSWPAKAFSKVLLVTTLSKRSVGTSRLQNQSLSPSSIVKYNTSFVLASRKRHFSMWIVSKLPTVSTFQFQLKLAFELFTMPIQNVFISSYGLKNWRLLKTILNVVRFPMYINI